MQNQKQNGGPKVTSFKQGPITPFIGDKTPATHSKGHLKGAPVAPPRTGRGPSCTTLVHVSLLALLPEM